MTCRRCQRRFRDRGTGVCPFCGESRAPVSSGIMKTSTILISEGLTDAVYRSVADVPGALRKRLLKSTSGMNSATILIADRRGKEELARAIRRLPGNAQQKLLDAVFGHSADGVLARFARPWYRVAVGSLLAVLTVLAIWLAVAHKL